MKIAAERLFEDVLNSTEELIIVFGCDLKVVMANQSMANFLELDQDEIIGNRLCQLVDSELANEVERLLEKVIVSGQSERYASSRDGRSYDTQLSPVFSDNKVADNYVSENRDVEYVASFTRDVSQLKNSKARMLKEIKRAEIANRAKTEFLANMSHELRTPLNSVLGFVQVLRDDQALNEDQKDSMNYIYDAGIHLKRLIEDILDLARVESGNLSVMPGVNNLVDVLKEVIDLSAPKIVANKLVLDTEFPDEDCFVFADRTRLKQVFINFLDNAIKYNVTGGSVCLKIIKEEASWKVSIKDTGVGIELDKQSALFEPFNRLGYESSGIPGTGIGLVLSKRLVEGMGGSIDFWSQINKGSQFDLTFPCADKLQTSMIRSVSDQTDSSVRDEGNPLKLLYIEDNESNIAVMKRFVASKDNWQLSVAKEGLEGFQMAQQNPADVILLDINLPDVNGLELAVMLNNTRQLQDIPVVAVTADGTDETRQACEYAGVHIVHTKPVDFVALEQTLSELASQ